MKTVYCVFILISIKFVLSDAQNGYSILGPSKLPSPVFTSFQNLQNFGNISAQYADDEERRTLDLKRAAKQKERAEQFEILERDLPFNTDHLAIVELPFEKLQQKLQTRELSATAVLTAYVAKALTVTKQLNCITEFVPSMWEHAANLDKLAQPVGPLHGIPMAVKDEHNIQGMDSTLGLSINLYKPAKEDSVVVQVFQNAGAVPFCKTNLPQTTFSDSSDNPIFGTTANHLNPRLSPGGSSAGTACLVGAGGAPFGTGSDIGGSVRIPAHFSGIATLTPTVGRISSKGIVPGIEGVAGVSGVSGILAPHAKTVASIFRIQTHNGIQNKFDPYALPLPFNDEVFESKQPLRIGYYTSLPFFPSLGDTPLTVLRAKQALENLGHSVLPFEFPDTFKIMKIFSTLTGADGGLQNFNKLRHDLVSAAAEKFTCGRSQGIKFYSQNPNSPCTPRGKRDLAGDAQAQRSEVLWQYLVQQNEVKYDILDRMKKLNLDLILSPVFPFPATRIEDTDILLNAFVYTATWNLVNFPAGVVPFGRESLENIGHYDDEGDFYLKLAKEGIKSAQDMPIGVQIIGKPYNEEMVLRILNELENYSVHQLKFQ